MFSTFVTLFIELNRNVRREMVRHSSKVSKKLSPSNRRNHSARARQIRDDMRTVADACPGATKLNLVIHYKMNVLGVGDGDDDEENENQDNDGGGGGGGGAGSNGGAARKLLLRSVWDALGQDSMPNLNELDLVSFDIDIDIYFVANMLYSYTIVHFVLGDDLPFESF